MMIIINITIISTPRARVVAEECEGPLPLFEDKLSLVGPSVDFLFNRNEIAAGPQQNCKANVLSGASALRLRCYLVAIALLITMILVPQPGHQPQQVARQ